jgi:hypothetical protein
MSLDPGEKRGSLRGPGRLASDGVEPIAVAVGRQILGEPAGPSVYRLDADERLAGRVEQVKPVAMTGTAHRGDRARIHVGRFEAFPNDCCGIGPELVEIALDVTGRGHRRLTVAPRDRELPASPIEQHGFDDRVAGVQAQQQVARFSHAGRGPTPPRPKRPCGSWP